MSDGRIVIDIAANSKGLDEARKKIQDVEKDIIKATNPPDPGDPFGDLGDGAAKAKPKISDLVKSIGIAQIGLKALAVVVQSIGGAVQRFDTMNQFPKIMEQMGYDADESQKSIDALSAGIDGLPTALDTVVDTTQKLTLVTKDLGESTKLTIALNNAFLASGKGASEASRGLEQYSQMLAKGEVDQQSWNTLIDTMPLALDRVAQSLLGATANQADLYSALKNGELTFHDFNQALIEANEGVGGFAEMALVGSEGIATSWQNINTAVVRGVANVIGALDDLVESATGKNIAQHFNSLKDLVSIAFNTITNVIKGSTPVITFAYGIFQSLLDVLEFFSPVIYGVVAAWGAFRVLQQVTAWMAVVEKAVWALTLSNGSLTAATGLLTTTQTTASLAQRTLATAYGLLTSSVVRATVAKQAATVVTQGYNAVLTAMSGPIGWIIAGIGLVVAGFVIFNKTLGQASEEAKAMADEMNNAAEKSEALATKIEDSKSSYDKHIERIGDNEQANLSLIDSLEEVMAVEEKSKADKEKVKKYVEALNESVQGLNLTYDDERDALNQSTEAMRTRIQVMGNQERANASLERMIEIDREQAEVINQLEVNQRLLADAEKERSETAWYQVGTHTALNESIQELTEKNEDLLGTQEALGVEMTVVEEAYNSQIASMEAGTDVLENQLLAYDELSEKQREVIDGLREKFREYEETATDVFNKVETVIKGTTADGEEYVKSSTEVVGEMIATLEHNQETLKTLGENIGGLRTQFESLGLDQAILDYFVDLGPDAAPYIQALAEVSDAELTEVATVFAEGGETAVQAMFDALGIDPSEYPENFTSMITNMEEDIKTQLEAAGFEDLAKSAGEDLVSGAVKGVSENAENLSVEMIDLAQFGLDAFEEKNGIQSPSTVYAKLGGFLVDGAVKGVSDKKSAFVTAIAEIASAGVSKFNEAVPKFTEAGRNAGRGFNDGLASMRNDIVQTARSIAQAAANTINRELVIQSPSKRLFQSGEFAGEGFELGILDKLKDVEEASRKLANASLPNLDLGRQYTRNYMQQSSQNITTNYVSAANDRVLTAQTNQLLADVRGVLMDISDTEQRILQKESVLKAFFDTREVTKELHEPMNDYAKMNDERKNMLKGKWA